ncbi:hypothetical protein LguiA_011527 [Lonicera macranthoides]
MRKTGLFKVELNDMNKMNIYKANTDERGRKRKRARNLPLIQQFINYKQDIISPSPYVDVLKSYAINCGSNTGIAQPQIGPLKDHSPTFNRSRPAPMVAWLFGLSFLKMTTRAVAVFLS